MLVYKIEIMFLSLSKNSHSPRYILLGLHRQLVVETKDPVERLKMFELNPPQTQERSVGLVYLPTFG